MTVSPIGQMTLSVMVTIGMNIDAMEPCHNEHIIIEDVLVRVPVITILAIGQTGHNVGAIIGEEQGRFDVTETLIKSSITHEDVLAQALVIIIYHGPEIRYVRFPMAVRQEEDV